MMWLFLIGFYFANYLTNKRVIKGVKAKYRRLDWSWCEITAFSVLPRLQSFLGLLSKI